ncbi:alpha/beta hydrolase [Streptomyces sp. cg40]|uniref:alpha/beta hydrolase n=1 Tax=Streptomyces sp. cg40 TaxID=3419764 RepID=UPI003D049DC2
MTLDNETRRFLEIAARNATKPRHEMTPDEAREAMRGLRARLDSGPAMYGRERFTVPVEGGAVPVDLLVPYERPAGLMVYFHGGGWVVGSAEEFEPLGRALAAATSCAVALVGYRKAPEHPYPEPVEDAWAALRWCAANAARLVGDRVPLFVGGDSAGANLAIAAAFRARDRGGPRIDGQLLAYPVTDCDFDRPSYTAAENQLMLTRDTMLWYWDHYLPDRSRRTEPEASPITAKSFGGLPPAVIVTAEHDVLRDEGEDFARALRAAGVAVTHRRFDGQMHAFLMMVGLLPGSAAGVEFLGRAIRDRLAALGSPFPAANDLDRRRGMTS